MTVIKPWGQYKVLSEGSNYVIKEIQINPGESISLQSHKMRKEVWTITSGIGKFLHGLNLHDLEELVLNTGDTVIVERNSLHKLECTSDIPLIFIEIQYGKCSEDDIIRYQDKYGRI